MTDASFVATGWIGTTVVLTVYTASVRIRTRRAVGTGATSDSGTHQPQGQGR